MSGHTEERDSEELELRTVTEDEGEECSFYVDELPDGLCVTQHKFYRWGDTAIFAVGELNYLNTYDDDDFNDTCTRFEAALRALAGIENPAAFVEAARGMMEALETTPLISGAEDKHDFRCRQDAWLRDVFMPATTAFRAQIGEA